MAFDAHHSLLRATTRWTYSLVGTAKGTRLFESFETIGTPAPMLFLERLVLRPRKLRRDMARTLAAIQRSVERG